jgi:uncharacterized protein YndB with AHSA1/START domain
MTVTSPPTTTTTSIRHRVGIEAPASRVHEAITTNDGVASWWTRDTAGDAKQGGTIDLHFGGPDMRIVLAVDEVAPERVVWRGLPGGPEEWVGTTMTFDLEEQDGETVILFTHAGWREPVPFQAHCSLKWAVYLMSLKSLVEGRPASAFPNDVKVSRFD